MGGRIEKQYEVLEDILAGDAKPGDLPLALLEDITDHFSEERKIGEGGFGTVYKGVFRNQNVAVKKIFVNKYTVDERLFRREVDSLMMISDHRNLVRFLGFCSNTARVVKEKTGSKETFYPQIVDRLLCFEYISNGSLDKHITDELRGLTWDNRFNIIRGICEGLRYLHEDKSIIHMDLKPANILLDDHMVQKITDFGQSRLAENTHTKGERFFTLGYCAPEYRTYGQTSDRADIYSLGAVIVELVTGTKRIPDITHTSLCQYDDMLGIEPLELLFSLEHNKQISCSVELTNETSNSIAFNIRMPSKQYSTRPEKGIVLPGCKRDVKITLQPQESATQVMNADKFVVQSTKVQRDLADENSIDDMFNNKGKKRKKSTRVIDEVNLMVVYGPEKYQVDRQEEEISKSEAFHGIKLQACRATEQSILQRGAIGSLVHKLSELLKYNLETCIRSDVDCVIQELRVMRLDLYNVSEVQRDNNNEQISLVKLWADEVRELSYDIEDVVDDFLMQIKGSEQATSAREMVGLIQMIGGAMKDIKNQVQRKSGCKGKYKVKEVEANTVSTINARHLSALFKDSEKIIGIDYAVEDFTKRLRGLDGQELKVHSIFGCGGLGKTTLARAVYKQLKGSFCLMAFVPVGRNPNVKKLFCDILFGLDKQRCINLKPEKLDEIQLISELRELLVNKRYLIVIDDLWDKKVWHDTIKFAFVDSKCGSKIIITTRIFDVAAIATDVYKLDQLSPGYSEELFYATLSPEEGRGQYDVTPEVLKKILVKCGGVPLAIITIASLLASKQRDDWPKVYNSIGFGHEVNEVAENTRKILLFSYSDLPRHLRTCLLHLSIYPEDKMIWRDIAMIWKDIAIWQWVAEGFVHEEPGRGLFEIGERYFNQLVSRSMIQLVVEPFNDDIRFNIHDLVLDMICSLSKDENFVTVLGTDEQLTSSKNNARRLAVQKRGIGKLDPTDCMVQLRSFYAIGSSIKLFPPLSSFKVLRVLSLEAYGVNEDTLDHLEHIGKLLQLRYLGLGYIPIRKLPEEIGDLLFLQTLILKNTRIKELPHSFGLLRQLKCLRISSFLFEAPNLLVNMTTLEDLSLMVKDVPLVFAEGLSNLKELRNLKIKFFRSRNDNGKKALLKSIGNLLNLQSLQILDPLGSVYISDDDIWEGFVPPRHLHSITMEVRFSSVPPWMDPTRLPSLSYLDLKLDKMEARCLEILGRLPELHTLKLGIYKGSWLVRCNGAFPKLRQLSSGTMLSFQQGVMPRLEYLRLIVDEEELREANFDCDFTSLGNLPFLQKLSFHLYGEDPDPEYAKRMEAAVKHALDT